MAANPDGTFTGTVTRETRWSSAPTPWASRCGQASSRRPDGEYWGGHQWFSNGHCKLIPTSASGVPRTLGRQGRALPEICLAILSSDLQPRIAPDGTSTDTPQAASTRPIVSASRQGRRRSSRSPRGSRHREEGCFSKRRFTIHLKNPKGDPLKSARVYVNGKRVKVKHKGKRFSARINLRGRKKGRYTVRIVAKTVLGKTIKGNRKYRTCAKKRTATA